MTRAIKINYLPGETQCEWHRDWKTTGRLYTQEEMFTSKVCPILWHTLYPYFLGAVFGAKYTYNEHGDCHVCCPAEFGVDVLVKVRPYDESFKDQGVREDWRDLIHAEVVKVNGKCDCGHQVGDKFVFPTCFKSKAPCPAGVHNLYPFLTIEKPSCINMQRLRCPDWMENVYYAVEQPE